MNTIMKNLIMGFSCFIFIFCAHAAHADTYTVDQFTETDYDGSCSDDDCTLRDAIGAANANDGDDIITLSAGTYTLSITGTAEDSNETGDLDVTDSNNSLTINGVTAETTIIDADDIDRIIDNVASTSTLYLNNLKIYNGSILTDFGGGIENSGTLELQTCIVEGNTANQSGGLHGNSPSTTNIYNSSIIDNSATIHAGGIQALSVLLIEGSLITGNSAGNQAGGILFNGTSGIIINSTISNNSDKSRGSGINFMSAVEAQLINTTVTDNTGGVGLWTYNGVVTLKNSIIDNASNCTVDAGGSGSISSLGYNIVSDTTCAFTSTGDLQSTDPLLNSLADNGGPTQTHALQSLSPAIDAIPAISCTDQDEDPLTEDQRGFTRPENTDCDIGAYEMDQTIPVISITSGTDALECSSDIWTDAGATATDNQDSIFDDAITVVSSGTVTEETVDAYTITYTATDNDGNVDTEDRPVTVQDTTAPTLTLTGSSTQTIDINTAYTDPGAIASDECDITDITVNIAGAVNTAVPGDYILTYTASDASGNPATEKTRTVTVIDVDADEDGVYSLNDCDDTDDSISEEQTYYQDADGDGLGDDNAPSLVCSNTAPTGYTTDSTDENDDDYDNDGVATESDCDDTDDSISEEQTYYQDADGDGLGDDNAPSLVCSNTAPTGYTTDSTDENDDDYDNDGVATESDCDDTDDSISEEQTYYQDADGDGLGDDNAPSLVCSYSVPDGYVLNNLDANGLKTNTVLQYKTGSNYYLDLNANGTKLSLINLNTNEILDKITLSKKIKYSTHYLKILTIRGKKIAVILSKKKAKNRLSLIYPKIKKGKLIKKGTKTFKNKNVKLSKTKKSKNKIKIKNRKGKKIKTYFVNKKFQLK